MALVVKNLPADAGDVREASLIPGSGRSQGMAAHSIVLAWRIPWTEEPGGLQVHRVAKSQTRLKRLSTHARPPSSWRRSWRGCDRWLTCLLALGHLEAPSPVLLWKVLSALVPTVAPIFK